MQSFFHPQNCKSTMYAVDGSVNVCTSAQYHHCHVQATIATTAATAKMAMSGITCGQRLVHSTAHCWSIRLALHWRRQRQWCWRLWRLWRLCHGLVLCLTAMAVVVAVAVSTASVDDDTTNDDSPNSNINDNTNNIQHLDRNDATAAATLYEYTEPHFQAQRHGIVQLFEWRFVDVASECESWLGPKGYAGVELSPITEHLAPEATTNEDATPAWSARYQPISYAIASNLGNLEDFRAMSQACNAAGVRVYATVVLNHMAAPYTTYSSREHTGAAIDLSSDMRGSGGEGVGNAATRTYSDFTAADFNADCTDHSHGREVGAAALRNCPFDLRPDLNQSRHEVRSAMQMLLNVLIEAGVTGFRVHAAEHMWPQDLREIFDGVDNLNGEEFDFPPGARPLVYMDVNDVAYGPLISRAEYTHFGLVLEHNYALRLHEAIWHRDLLSLFNTGPGMGYVQHREAVVFVDTPLQQRSGDNWGTTFRQRRRYVLATAFMLAHPYGRVQLHMSSYRYDRQTPAQGAPATSPTYDDQEQCEGEWVCEHRWAAVTAMIALANSLDPDEDVILNMQSYGPNQIAFGRGHKAFFAFNKDAERPYEALVHTGLPAGTYCDVLSGGRAEDGQSCVGRLLVVRDDSSAELNVPPLNDEVHSLKDVDESTVYSALAVHMDTQLQLDVGGTNAMAESTTIGEAIVADDAGAIDDGAASTEALVAVEQQMSEPAETAEEDDAAEDVVATTETADATEAQEQIPEAAEVADDGEVSEVEQTASSPEAMAGDIEVADTPEAVVGDIEVADSPEAVVGDIDT